LRSPPPQPLPQYRDTPTKEVSLVPIAVSRSDTSSAENSLLWYAERYVEAGFCPIPVKPKDKAPIHTGWPSLRIPFEELPLNFFGDRNIGIVLGDASDGLVDVDLDSEEAVILAAHFLPH